jgi:hypothetical protein
MRSRIRQLEQQLATGMRISTQSPTPTLNTNIETLETGFGGTLHVHNESQSVGHLQAIPRSVTHKTRLLGQSHWMIGISPLVSPHLCYLRRPI